MRSLVIAIGGNAISDPLAHSKKFGFDGIAAVAKSIAGTYRKGDRIVVTHGNGPQVGSELERNEMARKVVPEMPLYLLTAETESVIGSVMANAIRNELSRIGKRVGVCTVITHVVVSSSDQDFRNPTKPIGPFMNSRELAEELQSGKFKYRRFEKGFRRVVPSPVPKEILEFDAIKGLTKGNIVVACGGGGVAVSRHGKAYRGVNAVIDKDRCSSLLASEMDADALVVLTDTDYVYADYSKRSGAIRRASAKQLGKRLASFESGTMRPKIEACVEFVRKTGGKAYIGNISSLDGIIMGRTGTMITR